MNMFKATLASAMLFAAPVMAQTPLSVATGGTGGVYYPMGGGLAEVINNHVEGYTATAEVTGASVENMGLVATGDADLAIGLADTVYQAQTGTGRFEGQQLEMVRGAASLYANKIQIVTLADSGITSLDDLKGKRVSIGAPGSGTEVNAEQVLTAAGITYDDIDEQRLNFNETADALNNGDIDAGFGKHPVEDDLQKFRIVLDPVHHIAGGHDEGIDLSAAAFGAESRRNFLGHAAYHKPAASGLPSDELPDHARRCGTAKESVLLDEEGPGSGTRRAQRGRAASHAAADNDHVVSCCGPDFDSFCLVAQEHSSHEPVLLARGPEVD